MGGQVDIRGFPVSSPLPLGWTVVGIDVLRATTTAITAVAAGHRCFPVSSLRAAATLAQRLPDPILAGELGGSMPRGFHLQNSPVEVERLPGSQRPVILLSTTGTRLLCEAPQGAPTYAACLRNAAATAERLAADGHDRVLLLAGESRGEVREEDRLCCARIAGGLLAAGYEPASDRVEPLVNDWADAPDDAFLGGRSVEYLTRSGQYHDVSFTLAHIEDLDALYELADGELLCSPSLLRAWSM